MINKILRWLVTTIILVGSIIFVVKFSGPRILKSYVESGIGNCQTVPMLCKIPEEEVKTFTIDDNYLQQCIPYKFPKIELCVPKGFKVVQELIKKPYYKKKRLRTAEPVIYLLHQGPEYFCKLFPQVRKEGISNNYDFLNRLMHANLNNINNLNDAFFVIMKGIFTPDIGDQAAVKMIKFKLDNLSGFINYNLSAKGNFFDCNIFSKDGDFYKVYIKDYQGILDLNKVIVIISTVTNGHQSS